MTRMASHTYRRSWRDRNATRGQRQEPNRQRAERDKRGPIQKPAKPSRVRINRLPTRAELDAIPHVPVTEFELSDRETATLRRRLYAINRDGLVRYRTLREGPVVLVWRIR